MRFKPFFFLSRHLSPSSITLIKCSSCHSVSDKTRQWLDQSSIKKKRSWPCTTWRCTGRHCASKSCNWERPSRPPLSKRMTFDLVKSNLPLWEKVLFFFQRKRMNFPKDTLIISGTSILMRACLDLPAIRYFSNDWVQSDKQFFENPSVDQNCNSCYRASCFSPKLSSKYYTFGDQSPNRTVIKNVWKGMDLLKLSTTEGKGQARKASKLKS